jgi:hypothetical protein
MPAPVTVDLSGSLGYAGPWPVLEVTGATGVGTGSLVNAVYLLLGTLLNSGNQWQNGTQTITRHTNGDWLIKSSSTVYYRKTGSVTYPWSPGTWTAENGAGGTPVLTWRTPDPVGIDRAGTAYEGDPPVSQTPAANVAAPQIGILDGGTPSSTYQPAAVIDAGEL